MILYLLCQVDHGGYNPIGIYTTIERYKEEAERYDIGESMRHLCVFKIELNTPYNIHQPLEDSHVK